MSNDDDMERGRLIDEKEKKRKSLLVSPQTLKVILAVGPLAAKLLHLIIDMINLFKS